MSQNNNQELHVVLGAGPLGRAVTRSLLALGHRVRLVSRSGQPSFDSRIELVRADLNYPDEVARVTSGAVAVYQCAQPAHYYAWQTEFLPLVNSIIEGVAQSGAKLILGDNLYMYGDTNGAVITEDSPHIAHTIKGRVRATVDAVIWEAHQQGRIRAAIAHASDYYGPEADFVGDLIFRPILKNQPATGFLSIDVPHTLTYLPDFGQALAILGQHDEALGQDWIVPSAPAQTIREVAQLVFDQLDQPAQFNILDIATLKKIGEHDPTMHEFLEMAYEYGKPFVASSARFEQTFNFAPTSLSDGVAASLDYYRQQSN